ncbi:MAG: binding sensor regulator [Pseudonocardiales bacterium]|nr:binding sensor regulator [Pseudonocardiales bacterium]
MPEFDQWASLLASLRRPRPGGSHGRLVLQALELGQDVAPGIVGASLTEMEGAGFRTPSSSTPLALGLDCAQYAASSGPCISAVRDRQVQRIDQIGGDERWPSFAEAALERGVRSSLSYPVTGAAHPTALNVYSSMDAAFGSARSLVVAGLLARCIGQLSVATYPNHRGDDDQAQAQAQEQGQRVSAAVDALMRRRNLSRPEAFSELAHRGQAENKSIAVTAELELSGGEQTL